MCRCVSSHLHTGDPDADRPDNLQMLQDDLLQFGDATALKNKTNT